MQDHNTGSDDSFEKCQDKCQILDKSEEGQDKQQDDLNPPPQIEGAGYESPIDTTTKHQSTPKFDNQTIRPLTNQGFPPITEDACDVQQKNKDQQENGVPPLHEKNYEPTLIQIVKKYTNGGSYEGTLLNEMRHGGDCKYIWANGDEYQGGFKNNLRNGQGTIRFANGSKLQGEWLNDKLTFGTYDYKNGSVYQGDLVNQLREGKGTIRYQNNDVYVGDWLNDQKHGKGVYTSNGEQSEYNGDWLNGKKHGFGKCLYQDQDFYEGYYNDGMRSGNGKYISGSDGIIIYEGEWINNYPTNKQGEGTTGQGINLLQQPGDSQ